MAKVVLVVCDGLRDDTAREQMGYLWHLVETRLATRYTVIAELPTMSRPLYETICTGTPVSTHGVTSNLVVRRSTMPNLFEQAVKHKRTTAAAAYYWFSELYIRAPYDFIVDRETDDPQQIIQHGRFYFDDPTPDREVFAMGAHLIHRFVPDFVLIHPMGMDHMGETHGSDSPEYRNNAIFQDVILATLIPQWKQAGYTVLVTADHGITNDHMHGGILPGNRNVPLYILTPQGKGRGAIAAPAAQLQLAPTVCKLLGVPIPATMKSPALRL
jgi:predicted AlkP superfamily pyrophosphatase or phosphodiesterase